MECHEARTLIDERAHGSLGKELAGPLAEHLQACADCREDLRQLEKVRELIGGVKADAPPEGALENIWRNVQVVMVQPPVSASKITKLETNGIKKNWRSHMSSRWKLAAAISLLTAAMLILAFNLGYSSSGGPKNAATALAALGRSQISCADVAAPQACASPALQKVAKDKEAELGYQYETRRAPAAAQPMAGIAGDAPVVEEAASISRKKAGGNLNIGGGSVEFLKRMQDSSKAPNNLPPPATPAVLRRLDEKDTRPADDVKADTPEEAQAKQKIIKTGELTLEVTNYVETNRAVDKLVIAYHGFVADSRTHDLPGGTKRAEIVLRVSPEHFEELFAELKKLGLVLQERAGGQDITAQFTDNEARIKNLQITEARLQELVKSKTYLDKVQSVLEVEREITRVRGEIEAMQGQIRVWQNQISLSTIRLIVQEPVRPVPSGSLSVEVASVNDAKKTLDAALANTGGQLLSGQTNKREDGTLMGTFTLRVKFGRFSELAGAIKALGRTQDERIQNQPFGGGILAGAQEVPCDLSLVLFERSIQLPSASLNLEVPALSEALAKLNPLLASSQSAVISNLTERQPDGSTIAQLSLRVRAGNFATLLEALPSLGRVTHRTVNGESNVQGGAADVPCTLQMCLSEQRKQVPSGSMAVEVNSFSDTREKLTALVKEYDLQVSGADSQQRPDGTWSGSFRLGIKAEKMDDAVNALEKLGRVKTRQLQGLGLGNLSKVDPNIIGEVVLALEEKPTLAPQEEGAFRLLLRDTFGGFLTSMGYIVRGLALLAPWLALAGLVVWLAWRFSRRTTQKKSAE